MVALQFIFSLILLLLHGFICQRWLGRTLTISLFVHINLFLAFSLRALFVEIDAENYIIPGISLFSERTWLAVNYYIFFCNIALFLGVITGYSYKASFRHRFIGESRLNKSGNNQIIVVFLFLIYM